MLSQSDTDQRLMDLETKLSFQEDALDQLHLVLYRQQQQIDGLLQEVRRLGQQMPEERGAVRHSPRDELPPHY
ncbi:MULTISPECIES: SlyX family protein [Giesbergeria]|uniref:SlyX family protein n=1 Tax=Giesbergeria sinuosa TaxID=80883 RepID=A0ABV9QER0_9BURK